MPGRQLLHEPLQADHAVVAPQRLQPEELRVGDVQLRGSRAVSRGSSPGSPQPWPPPPPAPAGAHVGVGRAVVPVLDPGRHGQGPVEGAGEGQGSQEVLGLVTETACGKRGSAGRDRARTDRGM